MTKKQVDLLKENIKKSIPIRTFEFLAVNSICQDKNHVLFWDFDNIDLQNVKKSLSKTQSINGLSTIFIVESRNGYNAFCLDKFFIEHAKHILYYTRWNDFSHVDIGYKSNGWALRIGKDKKIIVILAPTDTFKGNIQSNAHKKFFLNEFGEYNEFTWGNFDDFSKVQIDRYKQDVI